MTAYGAVDRAVEAMRQAPPTTWSSRSRRGRCSTWWHASALGQLPGSEEDGPVALEPASRQLLELAARVARSGSTVLISGESGTGKEVLANYIHQHIAACRQAVHRDQLRGDPGQHARGHPVRPREGSFTGAIAAQPGKFEAGRRRHHSSRRDIGNAPRPAGQVAARIAGARGGAGRCAQADQPGYPRACHDQPRSRGGKSRRGVSARTSTIACRSSRWPGGRCANALRTSCRWPSVSLRKHSRKMNLGAVALGPEAAQVPGPACLAGQRKGTRQRHPACVDPATGAASIQPADLCLTAPIGMPLVARCQVPMPAMPPATPPSVEISVAGRRPDR